MESLPLLPSFQVSTDFRRSSLRYKDFNHCLDGVIDLYAHNMLMSIQYSFWQYLCLEEDKNLVISPLGISILLAMVADGARGQSLRELQLTLGLPETTNASNAGYQALINDLNVIFIEVAWTQFNLKE